MNARPTLFGNAVSDRIRRALGMNDTDSELRFELEDLHFDDSRLLRFGTGDDATIQFDGTNFILGTIATNVFGTGAAAAIIQSNGNFDLTLQTGNSTTGGLTITDGANGNIAITPDGSGQVDIANVHLTSKTQALTDTGATDVVSSITEYTTTGAATSTLADGAEGQHKFLVMVVDAGNQVLTPTNLLLGSTLTFDAVGDACHLLFTAGNWQIVGNQGVAIA